MPSARIYSLYKWVYRYYTSPLTLTVVLGKGGKENKKVAC